MVSKNFYLVFLAVLIAAINDPAIGQTKYERQRSKFQRKINTELRAEGLIDEGLKLQLDSFSISKKDKNLDLYFSDQLNHLPIRETWLFDFMETAQAKTKRRYEVNCFTKGTRVANLVPNIYRSSLPVDSTRLDFMERTQQHVKRVDNKSRVTKGLNNRHIAIWGGHGLYYFIRDSLWTWQRSNLFTTIEDKLTYSMVVPYIIPMMERAGANVYYPKERDTQTEEILIDNDSQDSLVAFTESVQSKEGGFVAKPYYIDYENPFTLGTHLEMPTQKVDGKSDSIIYSFSTQKSGRYAIYVSYANTENNVSNVQYEVDHSAGKTKFLVDQKMGWNTWVYIGTFQFNKGEENRVIIRNRAEEKGIISSDAIKIGGGYNRIMREGTLCKYPAYMNGARYFLQYAGMPDTAVYTLHNYTHDYKDDYKSRGEWVNYLLGKEYTWNRDSSLQGLDIPIDLSLSVHTDAGITRDKSTIGTLAIHSTTALNYQRTFPDGRTRYANRDLADVVQTEIVHTIRANHRDDWNRRAIWDKRYSEATYPNVPSMLIELFSHQNFEDMKHGLDPNFKFDISRAIYKGVLKYLAYNSQEEYVVSPLRVGDFSMVRSNNGLVLSWKETLDPLEETARPSGYIVYTQIGEEGFDNGVYVESNQFELENLQFGQAYSFKVTAVNAGGESFDSEILSAVIFDNDTDPVLMVNGFQKVSAPEYIESDSIGGFATWEKSAIADGYEYSFTGDQYNFNKYDPWITDPRTGHGASYSTYDGMVKAGNTWNYPRHHGKHYRRHNISYISTSLDGFEANYEKYMDMKRMDLIYGKQSTAFGSQRDYSLFKEDTRKALEEWLDADKSLLVSGAFIGTDVFTTQASDTLRTQWVSDYLHYKLVSDHASESGNVKGKSMMFALNMKPSATIYDLRNVDAITFDKEGKVLFRYPEKNLPAAIYSEANNIRKVILGFPVESVTGSGNELMDIVLHSVGWIR